MKTRLNPPQLFYSRKKTSESTWWKEREKENTICFDMDAVSSLQFLPVTHTRAHVCADRAPFLCCKTFYSNLGHCCHGNRLYELDQGVAGVHHLQKSLRRQVLFISTGTEGFSLSPALCVRARARDGERLLEWTQKNPWSCAEQWGSEPTHRGSDINMTTSVSRSPPFTLRPASAFAVSIYHTSILFADAPSVEWDVAIYRQICLIILMLLCDLSVLKADIWTPYARPSAHLCSLFLPVYIHLGFICNQTSQNNVQLLRQQQNTWDIFPRLSSKKRANNSVWSRSLVEPWMSLVCKIIALTFGLSWQLYQSCVLN